MKKGILVLLLMATVPFRAMQEGAESKKNKAKIIGSIAGQYALVLGINYVGDFLNTMMHELGHALVGKYFYNVPITIYLGRIPDNLPSESGVYLFGYNPNIGASYTGSEYFPTKQAVITLLTGPLMGLICAGVVHYILKKENILPKFTKKLCIRSKYCNYIGNLCQLIPCMSDMDGGRIAQRLGLVDYDGLWPTNDSIRRWTSALVGATVVAGYTLPVYNLYSCYQEYKNRMNN
jgi:hypothetical protein